MVHTFITAITTPVNKNHITRLHDLLQEYISKCQEESNNVLKSIKIHFGADSRDFEDFDMNPFKDNMISVNSSNEMFINETTPGYKTRYLDLHRTVFQIIGYINYVLESKYYITPMNDRYIIHIKQGVSTDDTNVYDLHVVDMHGVLTELGSINFNF